MSPDQGIAVLLDELLSIDGEIQIKKRRKYGDGAKVELTVWEPTGGRYPRVKVRVQGSTTIEALDRLEERIDAKKAIAESN
jgi:hypothetical protein